MNNILAGLLAVVVLAGCEQITIDGKISEDERVIYLNAARSSCALASAAIERRDFEKGEHFLNAARYYAAILGVPPGTICPVTVQK